jgi:4,5-dihydroxyphthalate decarboxylase
MSDLSISLGLSISDRSRPILDGRVTVPGCAVDAIGGDLQEIFHRASDDGEFTASEMSMGGHILATARGDSRHYGLPIFLSRVFRHTAIYVRGGAGIEQPTDLNGRTIGIPQYQQTANLWVRGILRDMYGVDTKSIHWRAGSSEESDPRAWTEIDLPADVDVKPIGEGNTLVKLFQAGELDGIISARRPSIASADGELQPLFKTPREAEEDYFRATGFFPIMHVVGIRKDVADANPWLPAELTKAFMRAKRIAADELMLGNFLRVSMPWVADHARAVKALMGDNPWRYGFRESYDELCAMLRYAAHDGLTKRQLEPAELFHPRTLDIPDGA